MATLQTPHMKNNLTAVPITTLDSRGRGHGSALAGDGTERPVIVSGAYPGDIADVRVRSRKAGAFLGDVQRLLPGNGPVRREPFCRHFADCGGCTIQDLTYRDQLSLKEAMVAAAFREALGELPVSPRAILGAPAERQYRNKLDFSFGAQRWLSEGEVASAGEIADRRGLGFHAGGRFDRVIDLTECHLQPEPSESIRSFFREYAFANNLSFYDSHEHHGLLRLLIIRTALTGETMVIVMFGEDETASIRQVMEAFCTAFPELASVNYVVNTGRNDSLASQSVVLWAGAEWITEKCGPNVLRIRPKAFYQTNPTQAVELYRHSVELAALTGTELVYDLYSGIGSIALYVATRARRVVGIETVEDAVVAARENAELNGISNVVFELGDVEAILPDVVSRHGAPELVFVDPPRAGLHPAARQALRKMVPERLVYISCNPRSQAIDIAALTDLYVLQELQPVDMFPQTRHVENIALLMRR